MRRVIQLSILILMLISARTLITTRASQGCIETTGTVTRHTFRSAIAQTTLYYSVYTPPCYSSTSQTYPVAYLMHGSNEDDGQWVRLGLPDRLDQGISDGTLPAMIVVMPFGEWIANRNQFDTVSWENVFLQELMPLSENTYRIRASGESRVIGGISRGGFWAFEIAFRHPELFAAVGGHSAFFDAGNAPRTHNPIHLALSAPGLERLAIWLDRGKDDFAAPGLDLMAEQLTERGLPFRYTVHPEGQHYLTYWRQHVGEYLQFYGDVLRQSSAGFMPTPIAFATNTPQPAVTLPPAADSESNSGLLLFLPATVFPSLQTTISSDRLSAIRAGQPDDALILSETTAATLRANGVALADRVKVVPDEALLNSLWRDRRAFTLLPFDAFSTRYRVLHVDGLHPLDMDLGTYPFAFSSSHPNYHPDRLTRIMLSGVTALTRLTRKALNERGVSWAGEAIRPFTERVDYFHTSNEVSFAPGCPDSPAPPLGAFCSLQEHFQLLTDIGLDIVELTGNHNNDYGTDAYLDTLAWYRAHGIQTVGGGANLDEARRPLVLEHHGNRIAMLACNQPGPYYALASVNAPGAAACDWTWLRTILPELSATYDLVIMTVQYQEVEDYLPTPAQISDFRGLADLGADVVIGTQAHKPQTFEFYRSARGEESVIHYGLGNLFFDQPFWGNSRFFMDQLLVYEGRLLTIDLFTGIIDDLARPRPMTEEEQYNFLAFMSTQNGS